MSCVNKHTDRRFILSKFERLNEEFSISVQLSVSPRKEFRSRKDDSMHNVTSVHRNHSEEVLKEREEEVERQT